MNLFGWIGIFFILGGVLFAGAALSMRGGKRIVAVEATIVSIKENSEEQEKESSRPEDPEDEGNTTEYEFVHEGETIRAGCHTMTSRTVGESERMYYDTFGGALYHPRMLGSMFAAAAAFAFAGILMILLQDTLLR